jgi:subtilisin-like proprotein convertase family protein
MEMTKVRTGIALVACASVVSLGLLAGATPAAAKNKAVNRTFSQCQNVALPLGDNSGTTQLPVQQIPFTVRRTPKGAQPPGGRVTGATVGVRISHTFDRDVAIYLVSPGGRVVLVDTGRGGSGDDFGINAPDCTGTLTMFSDNAATALGNASAPFAGTFRPDTPVSILNGGIASGVWTVIISDTSAGDNGTIHAVSLNLTYRYKAAKKK